MNVNILYQLDYRPRTFLRDGYRIDAEAAAFIGVNNDGEYPKLCVGLLDQKNHFSIYEPGYRFQPITAWRTMQILDQVEIIFYNTIQKVFMLSANQKSTHALARRLKEVEWYIPKIAELRKAAMQEPITDEIINAILQICNDSSEVPADTLELKWAVKAGIINQTEEVSRTYQIATELEQRVESQEQHIQNLLQHPLPAERNLTAFCDQFGIQYLCDDPDDVNRVIIIRSIEEDPTFNIWCAEYPFGAMQTGHVGHPVLELNDQRKVIMSLAYFDNDDEKMYLILHDLFDGENSESLTLAEVAAYEPKFIGHTLNYNDFGSMEDIKRGYYPI